ncbi:Diphthamide biosynthesis protein 3 [Elasticomyces elasticus]|nr:Diphthamide biosynthesis protein 3 [Elasticomyces elasticus]KAK3663349.1 Diphthamide biosynthesis protein 3 [Elasticomyces elasticus]KAK4925428.1 Diphthamide biosynthesis protein 3 [Elasticomyces elasticus]KAK5764523.1 Diphthamide biosynthesis protein 3 [Elasticomyces elasticus]
MRVVGRANDITPAVRSRQASDASSLFTIAVAADRNIYIEIEAEDMTYDSTLQIYRKAARLFKA